jgi:hypothetical protein
MTEKLRLKSGADLQTSLQLTFEVLDMYQKWLEKNDKDSYQRTEQIDELIFDLEEWYKNLEDETKLS